MSAENDVAFFVTEAKKAGAPLDQFVPQAIGGMFASAKVTGSDPFSTIVIHI